MRWLALLLVLTACAAPAPRQATVPRSTDATVDALDRAQERAALGDRDGAERAIRAGLEQLEASVGADHPSIAAPVLQLALVVSEQRRFGEAEALFARAERLLAEAPALERARLGGYRAVHLATAGQLDAAVTQARRATLARRDALGRIAESGNRVLLATGLAELAHGLAVEATINLRLGRLEPAEFAANLARRVLVDLADVPEWWIAEVDEIVGLIEAERRNFDPARDRLGTALATRLAVFGERRPVGLGLLALGRINDRAGDRTLALEDMRRGMGVLAREGDAGGSLGFARLNDYLATLAAEPTPAVQAEMFAAAQLAWRGATSRTISLTVARLAAVGDQGGASVERLQRAALTRDETRLQLGRETAKPAAERDAALIERLRLEVLAATEAATAATAALNRDHPRLAALVDTAPTSLDTARAALQPDEALVVFAIGPEAAWVFAASRTAVQIRSLSLTGTEIARDVATLRRSLDPGSGAVAPFDLATSHRLATALLGPVAEVVDPAARLVLVLDGALQSLPPGVLVRRPAAAGDYQRAAWLGLEKALTLVPSVRTFVDLRQVSAGSRAPKPLFALGNPLLTGRAAGLASLGAYCQTAAPVPADLVRALAPLPDTAAEVRQVAAALGAGADDVLLGAAATEERVRAARLDQYRVLYFATHGLLPGELRCEAEPGLVLTPPAQSTSRAADGVLTASDVARFTLDADLVVLSACNTAAAGALGGESLSGLARAFFHAGARSLLVSHWPVDSRATTALMAATFQVAPGVATDERLRRAQTALVGDARTAHPIYWAAFTLVGDGRVVLTSR